MHESLSAEFHTDNDRSAPEQRLLPRWFLPLMVLMLTIFLAVRYTPLLELFGVNIFADNPAVTSSLFVATVVPSIFFVFGSISLRRQWFESLVCILDGQPVMRWGLVVVVILTLTGVMTLAKYHYAPYGDEMRDVQTVSYLQEHGLGSYVVLTRDRYKSGNSQPAHATAVRHPPLHYWATVLTVPISDDVLIYRFWVYLPLSIAILMVILASVYYHLDWLMVVAVCLVMLSFAFLRNYTFIRYGNELFAVIGFTGYLAGLYGVYQRVGRDTLVPAGLGLAGLLLAIFSKFSAVVAVGSVGLAALICWGLYRQWRFGRVFIFSVFATCICLFMYSLAFWGTPMAVTHLNNYLAKFLKASGLPLPESLAEYTVLDHSSSSLSWFAAMIPFWYGPIILILVAGILARILRERYRLQPLEFGAVLLVVINILAVLVVNPRAQYTASVLVALAWLVVVLGAKFYRRVEILRLGMICVFFIMAETLISAL